MYTVTDKLLLVAIGVLFLMAIILCVFSANLAAAWLTNKREERKSMRTAYAKKTEARADADRTQWMQWLDDKEKRCTQLELECGELRRRLERTVDLLNVSERERQKLLKGEE